MTDELPPECARLAQELRGLRERTGLSLAALAERTAYSKSSWQRYLRGTKLPPRRLVLDLCELAREPTGRLLALWELAESAWSGRAGQPRRAAERTSPLEPPGARFLARLRRRSRLLVGAVLLALTGSAGIGVALSASEFGDPAEAPLTPGCHSVDCTGRDPQSNACTVASSDPAVIAEHRFEDGTQMDIRYSTACEAGWARVWFGQIGDRIELRAPDQGSQWAEIIDEFDAEGYLYTPLLGSAPENLRACLIPVDGGRRQCFAPDRAPG